MQGDVNAVAVVGAGTMGAGIAQLAAAHGCVVYLHDVDRDAIGRGIAGIAKRLRRSVEKGRMSEEERERVLQRIRPTDVLRGMGEVELAVEAVVEDLTVKRAVFTALEEASAASAVLATNTSSLSITRIAEAVKDPSRVVGMHFFNPAPVMRLVEVVAGEQSDASAVETAVRAAKRWGKVPVRVKDTAGFIVNRVARGFYLEGLRLLDEGVAGVDEVDRCLCAHGGFKMGPFALMDLIGVDVNLAVSTSVWERLGQPARLSPHWIQRELVTEGHLGRKTGRGFYRYDPDGAVPAYVVDRQSFAWSPLLSERMHAFTSKAGAGHAGSTEQLILSRILAAIINEAAFALSERVASSDDIDTAMIQGTKYPKGPLGWADDIGHGTVRGLLRALNETVGDGRYAPAPLFR